MNWRHETWRRLYVREQGSFAALSYSARSLAAMLLKHVDDRGRFVARRGEPLADAICFRVGASRTERRLIKSAVAELLEDGYLVLDGPGVRIRNFSRVNGDGPERESDGIGARPVHEPSANDARPVQEDRVNVAESPESPGVVPSVPSLEDPERAHAIPEAGAWPQPPPEPVRYHHGQVRVTGMPPPGPTRQLELVAFCDFHRGGVNAGRPAVPPRQACAECRRVGTRQIARRDARPPDTPKTAGEIMGAHGWPPRAPPAGTGPAREQGTQPGQEG